MFDLFAVFILLQIALAFILCFFGYRHIRLLVSAYAFIAGFLASYFLLSSIGLSAVTKNIIYILVGLFVSGLTYMLYKIAMFAAGAGLGFSAGVILCYSFEIPLFSTVGLIILFALGFAAGALSISYKKILLILSTSICGALLLSLHGGYLITVFSQIGFSVFSLNQSLQTTFTQLHLFFSHSISYLLGATLLLSIAGIIVQFKKSGRKK